MSSMYATPMVLSLQDDGSMPILSPHAHYKNGVFLLSYMVTWQFIAGLIGCRLGLTHASLPQLDS